MKWTMMRHGDKVKHLGRPADQRKALIRSLVTETLRHGQIRTTKVKAKVIRSYVDKMITLAKDGSLHARRQALAFVYDKEIVANLFAAAPERYGGRKGGYTRVKPEPYCAGVTPQRWQSLSWCKQQQRQRQGSSNSRSVAADGSNQQA
ncbi:ribosomal protein L17 [Scenedesmus sp. NREL 46B-D3]|nr:ribosomal protein L17 [Scenedesmus sp. NREL 46B-D3]